MAIDPRRALPGRPSQGAAGARLGDLFEEHGRMVYGLCRLLLRDAVEAEDAAQQAFLSAYRSMLSGHEPREPAAWLATIARNECRARIRDRMASPLYLVDDHAAAGGDAEQAAARRAEVEELCTALAELPQQQREAIVLREFYGLSYDEVGVALGVSGGAVESLIFRGRRRLQEQLRPARLASGALVVPLTLRDSLAQAAPGFASASAGAQGGGVATAALAKLASPVAAKVAAVALVVTAGGGAADAERRGADPARSAVAVARAVERASEDRLLEHADIVAARERPAKPKPPKRKRVVAAADAEEREVDEAEVEEADVEEAEVEEADVEEGEVEEAEDEAEVEDEDEDEDERETDDHDLADEPEDDGEDSD